MCGYLVFCEVVLRPESDVVSDICINHVLILSHLAGGWIGGVRVLMLWWSVHMYLHADQNGSIFQA